MTSRNKHRSPLNPSSFADALTEKPIVTTVAPGRQSVTTNGNLAAKNHASSISNLSPGKDSDLSVSNYVSQIHRNWQRGVDAFMTIALLCAEASARLTITEREGLAKQLPFGDSAFSKFVQIGNDHRLNTPELRRLLPPHCTVVYSVTLLTDEELQDAIAAKIIHPEMGRSELQRWRNSHRELSTKGKFAASPKEAASGSAVASPPTAPTQGEAATGIFSPQTAAVQPDGSDNLDIPPLLDRRDPEKAFAALRAAWEAAEELNTAWASAPRAVQTRFVAEVLGIIVADTMASTNEFDPAHEGKE